MYQPYDKIELLKIRYQVNRSDSTGQLRKTGTRLSAGSLE